MASSGSRIHLALASKACCRAFGDSKKRPKIERQQVLVREQLVIVRKSLAGSKRCGYKRDFHHSELARA